MLQSESKKYRIGIDVGTASVAAVAIELDDMAFQPVRDEDVPVDDPNDPDPENNEATYGDYAYFTHRLRLFDEPVEDNKGTLISKNTARRLARMARRQISRRSGRLMALRELGYRHKLITPGDEFHQPGAIPLPKLRSDAATQRVELPDLMRIILRLSKRRGYKGEFRPRDESKMGEVEFGANSLAKEMGSRTLGQYLYQDRYLRGKSTKLKLEDTAESTKSTAKSDPNANVERNLYALRQMVEAEFDQIWQTQAKFHAELQGSAGDRLKQAFLDILFYQRPLKSVAGMVGTCPLEPTLPRAPKAQMAFQRFRIEKTLADMRWSTGKQARFLSPEQKSVIRHLCQTNDKISFAKIIEALGQAGCPKPFDRGLNLESSNRNEIQGNETLAAWRELDASARKNQPDFAATLYDEFAVMEESTQVSVINFLADITPDVFASADWPDRFPRFNGKTDTETAEKRAKNQQLLDFVEHLRHHQSFNRLSNMKFPSGRASYSVKALNRLANHMEGYVPKPNQTPNDLKTCELDRGDEKMEKFVPKPNLSLNDPKTCKLDRGDNESAIHFCYREKTTRRCVCVPKSELSIQMLPPAPLTGSATVDVAMRQIRIAVNKIIEEISYPPAEIVIEMAREMSLGPKARNEREIDIGKNQKMRTKAKFAIIERGQAPTQRRITKYLLWAEQNEFCPYCGQTITLDQALSEGETEIDHIIPKSLTQVGRKRSEIVLAHQHCNQEKRNRTPFQAWGQTDRFAQVKKAAARFEKNGQHRKAKLLLLEDFETEVLTDDSISGFADRQFHQTAWIAKAARDWMEPLCPGRVSVSRGEMTSLLRANWGLNTVIPEIRYEEGRKVFDTGGTFDPTTQKLADVKEITKADFDLLRKYLEGHKIPKDEREADKATYPGFDFARQIDKRIDHRHHIIDALVIAMTSRRMFQKMAREYKILSESPMAKMPEETQESFEKRMKKKTKNRLRTPNPPIKHLGRIARDIIRNPRITVKPDRYVGGRFAQATAYRWVPPEKADNKGNPVLSSRSSVIGLLGKSVTEMERNIGDIVSIETREAISHEINRRLASGLDYKDLKQSLFDQPIMHPRCQQPIKKVFCKQRIGRGFVTADPDNLVTVKHGRDKQHTKYYLRDGYAYIELVISNGNFVSANAVANIDAEKTRHQPKPPGMIRIYKKDTLRDKRDGKLYVVQQIHGSGKVFLTHIYESRNFGQMDASDGNQIVSGKGLLNYEYELVTHE
ncbi:MAG: HNH endonuclease domain-containing protein [Candidatus Symbiobacter sp.]|nr:HNH endonuclease domain-containing protein [Candidatus Symbiobacter sp.]